MDDTIEKYKGFNIGKIIQDEYTQRGISQRDLAAKIGEHFQTLNAVINGRRRLTMELADKLDSEFGFEPGTLWVLQARCEVEEYQFHKHNPMKGRPKVRASLFSDVDLDRVNWGYRKDWAIKCVFRRGSREEKEEILRFYSMRPFAIGGYQK